ncbi:flagellar basal body rod protein FlgB [Granulicella sp. 5B5]|uniref:flagellar basal body rod protein FlgB n=1 Tax=Granulicella sp. 5B5 TaxID=1617967 RepID=UPI0015F4CE33|nr:flagellar basal body rod protein FlgB [Granulicella sp. 5B5]QMV17529.1 flagellar basal body rod protein FlgB [Granulicella sp. 5B5]
MTQPSVTLNSLEAYLRLTSMREQVVTGNMANIDTPGYHTRDIDFSTELNRFLDAGSGDATVGATQQLHPASYEVASLLQRPDGNNVDLDREGTLLAELQLQHEMGVQLIKDRFHMILTAINGGGQ